MAKTIDPKKVIITFGDQTINGFADGTFLEIEMAEDGIVSVAGADGEVARAINRSPLASVTITLLQTSESNDYFTAQHKLDKETGKGKLPLMVRDLFGKELLIASQAWVRKPATISRSKEVESREWVLDCQVETLVVGGNY